MYKLKHHKPGEIPTGKFFDVDIYVDGYTGSVNPEDLPMFSILKMVKEYPLTIKKGEHASWQITCGENTDYGAACILYPAFKPKVYAEVRDSYWLINAGSSWLAWAESAYPWVPETRDKISMLMKELYGPKLVTSQIFRYDQDSGLIETIDKWLSRQENELMISLDANNWLYYRTSKNQAKEALKEFVATCENQGIIPDNLTVKAAVLRAPAGEVIDEILEGDRL